MNIPPSVRKRKPSKFDQVGIRQDVLAIGSKFNLDMRAIPEDGFPDEEQIATSAVPASGRTAGVETMPEDLESDATRALQLAFNNARLDHEKMQRASPGKHLYNALAASIVYLPSFGLVGAAARLSHFPALVPLAVPALHTLLRPIAGLVQSTVVSNPSDAAQAAWLNTLGNSCGDTVRRCAGAAVPADFPWSDPEGGTPQLLTAQARLEKESFWMHWKKNLVADNFVTVLFTITYSLEAMLIEFLRGSASTEDEKAAIAIHLGVGVATAASVGVLIQVLRKSFASETGGQEIVVKSTRLWKLEADYLVSRLKDLEGFVNAPVACGAEPDPQVLMRIRKEMCATREKLLLAEARSSLLTSLLHEYKTMFGAKLEDTAHATIAKMIALVPYAVTSHLTGSLLWLATPWTRATASCVSSIALIFPGWGNQKELEGVPRVLAGIARGLRDAMKPAPDAADAVEAGAAGF